MIFSRTLIIARLRAKNRVRFFNSKQCNFFKFLIALNFIQIVYIRREITE